MFKQLAEETAHRDSGNFILLSSATPVAKFLLEILYFMAKIPLAAGPDQYPTSAGLK